MTSTAEPLRLRLPLWARAGILGFLPVWAWFSIVPGNGTDDLPLPAVLIIAVATGFAARMVVLGVTGTEDGRLTVRNHWSTRTFAPSEVAGVEIDRADGRFGTGWAVWLLRADGSRHRLDVTQTPFRTLFAGRLERDAAAVRAWLHASGRR